MELLNGLDSPPQMGLGGDVRFSLALQAPLLFKHTLQKAVVGKHISSISRLLRTA